MPSQQGRNKGIAFVQFTNSQHAEVARQAMDRKFLAGRLLHIIPSSSRLGGSALNSERLESRQSDTFIQRKRSRLVMQADQSFNWASLYIGVSDSGVGQARPSTTKLNHIHSRATPSLLVWLHDMKHQKQKYLMPQIALLQHVWLLQNRTSSRKLKTTFRR